MIDKRPRWINSGTVLRHHWKPEKRKKFSLLMSAMTTPSDYLGLSRVDVIISFSLHEENFS